MSRKPYMGPSESQSAANAEALARRERTYSAASGASFTWAYDYHQREPRTLRELVHYLRNAHAAEVPTRLHEHDLADDGTPRMTKAAEGFIFGRMDASDAAKGDDPLLSYHLTPFRAALHAMRTHRVESDRMYGALVHHVVVAGMGPHEAAVKVGVPRWCASTMAEIALRAFWRSMSDLRLAQPIEPEPISA